MAQQLNKIYKEETMSLIKENPYRFVLEIEGFGFPTADKIAQYNGISKSNPNRIQASCIYALQQSVLDGHVYLPIEKCMEEMKRILQTPSITNEVMNEQIETILKSERVIRKEENIYLPSLYYAEENFVSHVKRITEHQVEIEVTDAELMKL